MIFKICGLKTKESVLCCEMNNVDFFGMIFYENSPRYINFTQASNLINFSKKLKIEPVGVFVNYNINLLKEIILSLDLPIIQLHGNENQSYIDEIKKNTDVKIIKKLSIQTKNDLKIINNFYDIDYFLFDYNPTSKELPGGNSKTFDWSLLKELNIEIPWFVSGGINQTNIKNIEKVIKPDGIDLSSGVEGLKGIKSNKKINNLFKIYHDN